MLCTAAAAAVLLAGCTSSSGQPTSVASSTATPTTGSAAPTTASPTAGPAQPVPGPGRSAADLRAALLAPADLPAGWTVVPDPAAGVGPSAASDPQCLTLLGLANRVLPGAVASARVGLSAGSDGPLVGEQLWALGTTGQVAAMLATFQTAVDGCREVTLEIPGRSPVAMTVSDLGIGPGVVGAKFTPVDPKLARYTAYGTATGHADTLLVVGMVGVSDFERVNDLAMTADEKATRTLGITG